MPFTSDSTLSNSIVYRIADRFVYVACAAVVVLLVYGALYL